MLRSRLAAREVGSGLEWHLNRSQELEQIMSGSRVEDFVIDNNGRALRDVANELLVTCGWIRDT